MVENDNNNTTQHFEDYVVDGASGGSSYLENFGDAAWEVIVVGSSKRRGLELMVVLWAIFLVMEGWQRQRKRRRQQQQQQTERARTWAAAATTRKEKRDVQIIFSSSSDEDDDEQKTSSSAAARAAAAAAASSLRRRNRPVVAGSSSSPSSAKNDSSRRDNKKPAPPAALATATKRKVPNTFHHQQQQPVVSLGPSYISRNTFQEPYYSKSSPPQAADDGDGMKKKRSRPAPLSDVALDQQGSAFADNHENNKRKKAPLPGGANINNKRKVQQQHQDEDEQLQQNKKKRPTPRGCGGRSTWQLVCTKCSNIQNSRDHNNDEDASGDDDDDDDHDDICEKCGSHSLVKKSSRTSGKDDTTIWEVEWGSVEQQQEEAAAHRQDGLKTPEVHYRTSMEDREAFIQTNNGIIDVIWDGVQGIINLKDVFRGKPDEVFQGYSKVLLQDKFARNVFAKHCPPGIEIKGRATKELGVAFVNYKKNKCDTHSDAFNGFLMVLAGRKVVKLAPPSSAKKLRRDEQRSSSNYFHDDPFNPFEVNVGEFREFVMYAGDGMIIPDGWIHSILSDPGTVAVSLKVAVSSNH